MTTQCHGRKDKYVRSCFQTNAFEICDIKFVCVCVIPIWSPSGHCGLLLEWLAYCRVACCTRNGNLCLCTNRSDHHRITVSFTYFHDVSCVAVLLLTIEKSPVMEPEATRANPEPGKSKGLSTSRFPRRCNPDDSHFRTHCRENLRFYPEDISSNATCTVHPVLYFSDPNKTDEE